MSQDHGESNMDTCVIDKCVGRGGKELKILMVSISLMMSKSVHSCIIELFNRLAKNIRNTVSWDMFKSLKENWMGNYITIYLYIHMHILHSRVELQNSCDFSLN